MKKLEAYKGFSFIAWTTVVLFSLFTYNLTLDLQKSIDDLSATIELQSTR